MDEHELLSNVGKVVYARTAEAVWEAATLLRYDGKLATVVRAADGVKCECAAADLLPHSERAEAGVDDLIALDVLNEAAILTNVHTRYHRQSIYTYVGPILLSVNPYQPLPIYGQEILNRYVDSHKDANAPHLYQVAEAAFRNVLQRSQNQAVLISGESGAGKTEATKVVLHYLTQRSQQLGKQQGSKADEGSVIQQRILDANPVLEAFGNATTIRNTNSSRFGKLFQVQYNSFGLIVGARLTKYLLEKSRVVSQAPNERNYHIFYQLCAGATEEERTTLGLQPAECYHYLCQNDCSVEVEGINDREGFQKVRNGLAVLGINAEEQTAMWRAVAAILHLGNLCFVCNERTGETAIDPSTASYLEWAALMLNCETQALQQALCFRTMSSGRTSGKASVYQIPLNLEKCLDSRDALAKHLYSLLFDWLVERVNRSMDNGAETTCTIGVLDIFGFEVMDSNGFEQLCINYANEKLHQQFTKFFFRSEQEAYVAEEIPWEQVRFVDNQECLDLLEGKPLGIFSLLQEQCQMGRNMDDAMLVDLFQSHLGKHPDFRPSKFAAAAFVVKHYAGDVSYNSDGFLEKNKDTLHDDLVLGLEASECPFIKQLVMNGLAMPSASAELKGPAKDKNRRENSFADKARRECAVHGGPKYGANASLSKQFMQQVDALMQLLSSCDLHYVRCIKPNDSKSATSFQAAMVVQQLQYSGVLECIKLRRAGFAMRVKFEEVLAIFQHVREAQDVVGKGSGPKEQCRLLLAHLGIPEDDFLLGKTLCFIKQQETMNTIYTRLLEVKKRKVLIIQAAGRGFLARQRFRRKLAQVVRVQAAVRRWLAMLRLRRGDAAARCIQRWWRVRSMWGHLHRIVSKSRAFDQTLKKMQSGISAKIQEEEQKRQERMAARGVSSTFARLSPPSTKPPPPSDKPPPPSSSNSKPTVGLSETSPSSRSGESTRGGAAASPTSSTSSTSSPPNYGSAWKHSPSFFEFDVKQAKAGAKKLAASAKHLALGTTAHTPPALLPPEAVVKQGYAWKKGGSKMGSGPAKSGMVPTRQTWRRRWFVLSREGALRYYAEQGDVGSYKGEISLRRFPLNIEVAEYVSQTPSRTAGLR